MCGLVGMAGDVLLSDKKALNLLLRFDVSRGWDSTGLAVVDDKTGLTKIYKSVGPPEYMYSQNEDFSLQGLYQGSPGKVFIGHNRAATRGKVSEENAHPFIHDGIVGAHNGTLISTHKLEDGDKFEVDSEAIFYNLSKYDPKDVIKNIYGAYALTWYDEKEEKLYIIRNSERPLFHTRRTDRCAVFWASEKWMLEVALKKAGVDHGEIKSFEINTLYSFDMSDSSLIGIKKTDWEEEKNVFGYKPAPVVHYNVGGRSNNVHPFVGSSQNSPSKEKELDIPGMRLMEGAEVVFKMNYWTSGVKGSEYIVARPTNPAFDYEIRIYGHNHASWNLWRTKLNRVKFRGRLKKLVDFRLDGKRYTYFLIDLRTVKEEKEEADNTAYEGFQGRYLSKQEWDKATSKGCAGCGSSADDHDHDLVFIDHDEFLCGKNGCSDTYREFIPFNVAKEA